MATNPCTQLLFTMMEKRDDSGGGGVDYEKFYTDVMEWVLYQKLLQYTSKNHDNCVDELNGNNNNKNDNVVEADATIVEKDLAEVQDYSSILVGNIEASGSFWNRLLLIGILGDLVELQKPSQSSDKRSETLNLLLEKLNYAHATLQELQPFDLQVEKETTSATNQQSAFSSLDDECLRMLERVGACRAVERLQHHLRYEQDMTLQDCNDSYLQDLPLTFHGELGQVAHVAPLLNDNDNDDNENNNKDLGLILNKRNNSSRRLDATRKIQALKHLETVLQVEPVAQTFGLGVLKRRIVEMIDKWNRLILVVPILEQLGYNNNNNNNNGMTTTAAVATVRQHCRQCQRRQQEQDDNDNHDDNNSNGQRKTRTTSHAPPQQSIARRTRSKRKAHKNKNNNKWDSDDDDDDDDESLSKKPRGRRTGKRNTNKHVDDTSNSTTKVTNQGKDPALLSNNNNHSDDDDSSRTECTNEKVKTETSNNKAKRQRDEYTIDLMASDDDDNEIQMLFKRRKPLPTVAEWHAKRERKIKMESTTTTSSLPRRSSTRNCGLTKEELTAIEKGIQKYGRKGHWEAIRKESNILRPKTARQLKELYRAATKRRS